MNRYLQMRLLELMLVCAMHTTALRLPSALDNLLQPLSAGNCSPQPQAYDVGERATCTFARTVDVDPTRIPVELPAVKCNCPDTLCSSKGDYRCLELKDTFQVAYRGRTASSALTNGTLELTTSCVCAVSRTAGATPGGARTANINKVPL